jgi:hypothetical protein
MKDYSITVIFFKKQSMSPAVSGDPVRGGRKIHEQEIVPTLASIIVQRAQILLGQEVDNFGW